MLKIEFISFGFKHSPAIEAEFVFDFRSLPNPFYVEELRDKTGLDEEIRAFIMQAKESKEYFERLVCLIDFLISLYEKEGKESLKIALGCTGGQHRSVAFAEILNEHFKEKGHLCSVFHRDINQR